MASVTPVFTLAGMSVPDSASAFLAALLLTRESNPAHFSAWKMSDILSITIRPAPTHPADDPALIVANSTGSSAPNLNNSNNLGNGNSNGNGSNDNGNRAHPFALSGHGDGKNSSTGLSVSNVERASTTLSASTSPFIPRQTRESGVAVNHTHGPLNATMASHKADGAIDPNHGPLNATMASYKADGAIDHNHGTASQTNGLAERAHTGADAVGILPNPDINSSHGRRAHGGENTRVNAVLVSGQQHVQPVVNEKSNENTNDAGYDGSNGIVGNSANGDRCFRCGETTHYSRNCETYKTKICTFWKRGRHGLQGCRHLAADCWDAHGENELRDYVKNIVCGKCAGPHKTEFCRRRFPSSASGGASWAPLWECSWCKTNTHSRDDCPEKWCKTCETDKHWTAQCKRCAHCKDYEHRTGACPYVRHPPRRPAKDHADNSETTATAVGRDN
jgi:hypothetical protein